jgi:hypothetical protein
VEGSLVDPVTWPVVGLAAIDTLQAIALAWLIGDAWRRRDTDRDPP